MGQYRGVAARFVGVGRVRLLSSGQVCRVGRVELVRRTVMTRQDVTSERLVG